MDARVVAVVALIAVGCGGQARQTTSGSHGTSGSPAVPTGGSTGAATSSNASTGSGGYTNTNTSTSSGGATSGDAGSMKTPPPTGAGGFVPCAAVCGNGVREDCPDFPPAPHEQCDGKDLVGRTCEQLGYLSGTLTCTDGCMLDSTGCEPCPSLDQHLVACGDDPFGSFSDVGESLFGVAATDTDIGVTWAAFDDSRKASVWFARLGADLSLAEPPHPVANPAATPMGLSIVARKNGWLVAIDTTEVTADGIETDQNTAYELDATGQVTRSTLLPNGKHLWLVGRPDGGDPLAVWREDASQDALQGASLLATIVKQDATSVVPTMIAGGLTDSAWLSAAATTTGFILAKADLLSSGQPELVGIHLDANAQPDPPVLLPPGVAPALAPHGDGVTMLFVSGTTASWMRLDGSAHPTGAPVAIPDVSNALPLDLGADTGLIETATKLQYVRLDASGKPTTAHDVAFAVSSFTAVTRGPEIVFAWLDRNAGSFRTRLRFARIAP